MDALNFTYWLQGFAELNQGPPSAEQWQAIREHLQLVFNKVTPPAYLGQYKPGEVIGYRSPTDALQASPPLRTECSSVTC